jgi:hypothetical protein
MDLNDRIIELLNEKLVIAIEKGRTKKIEVFQEKIALLNGKKTEEVVSALEEFKSNKKKKRSEKKKTKKVSEESTLEVASVNSIEESQVEKTNSIIIDPEVAKEAIKEIKKERKAKKEEKKAEKEKEEVVAEEAEKEEPKKKKRKWWD